MQEPTDPEALCYRLPENKIGIVRYRYINYDPWVVYTPRGLTRQFQTFSEAIEFAFSQN